jgi:predicted Zn-dependent protease
MTLMDDESELAFVLGHETGHVAAGHAQQREEAENRAVWQQLPWIMLGQMIGGNFGSIVARRGLVSAALETLSFSREQEYEADTLGLRYMVAAGYDPAGAPEMLEALTRNSAMEARVQGRENRQLPEWALTHPLSENRKQRAAAEAKASGRIGIGIRNRDGFLAPLNGVVVDDDPAQGIIDGRTFTHPDLRIQFSVPVGYLMQNGTRAVSISGSAGKAQFGGGRYRGNLDSYVYAVMQELAGNAQLEVPRPQHTVIDGVPAAYTITRANTDSGVVDVSVVAYQWAPDTVYHFVMLTAGGSGMGPFLSMVNSIRKITPAEAAAIRPRIVLVTTVRPGDTVQSLASRMAYRNFKVDRFLALNNLPSNARVEPGQKIKLVVYGQRRS